MDRQRTILHVDMDAFFAAVEQMDNPALRGRPVIVGAARDARGVVATCSYEARRYGVHSAMPSRTAAKLCPDGVFVPVRGERYREVSAQIFHLFGRFSPDVEKLSIDEAFIDITASMKLFGGAVGLARELKTRLWREVGVIGSVGLAPNKFLAKLASDLEKPDGLTVVPREPAAIAAFLAPLGVRRIWGVGPQTAARLERWNLRTIGDVQRLEAGDLKRLVGDSMAQRLWHLSRGIDERELNLEPEEKSVSHEHTFDVDCQDWSRVERTLLALAEKVGARIRARESHGRVAVIKLRWANFETITRQRALEPPISSDRALIAVGLELLRAAREPRPVRLVGFGVVLADAEAAWQPSLFAGGPEGAEDNLREADLDRAVDEVRKRFGRNSIKRGDWQ